jgi:hypothetical protein
VSKFNKQKKDERNCQRFKKTKEVQPTAPAQRIAPHLFFLPTAQLNTINILYNYV